MASFRDMAERLHSKCTEHHGEKCHTGRHTYGYLGDGQRAVGVQDEMLLTCLRPAQLHHPLLTVPAGGGNKLESNLRGKIKAVEGEDVTDR